MPASPTTPETRKLYLEDLKPGDRFASGEHALDEAQIIEFATALRPAALSPRRRGGQEHLLPGPGGQRLAHGGDHDAAAGRQRHSARRRRDRRRAARSSWPRPTRPGDVLHVESEVVEVTPSRSKPERGLVQMRCDTLNQRGEVVQRFTPKLVVSRRPT